MENIPRLVADNLVWIAVVVGIAAFVLGAVAAGRLRRRGDGER